MDLPFGSEHPHTNPSFVGCAADVRDQYAIRRLKQVGMHNGLFLKNVEPGTGYPSLLKGFGQSGLVDKWTASGVDYDRCAFHLLKQLPVNHMPILRSERAVQR